MSWSTRSPQLTFLTLVALTPTLSQTAAQVIFDRVPLLRPSLGDNRGIGDALRARLVEDRRAEVRAAGLRHSSDTVRLVTAARSTSPLERQAVAANPATPEQTLLELATDAPARIARCLLTNPTLPHETAVALGGRFAVGQMWGPGRSLGSSQGSAAWRSSGVAATLQAHPQVATCWLSDPEPTTVRVIAYSPCLAETTARRLLAERPNRQVQMALAANPFVADDLCDNLTAPTARAARGALRATLGNPQDLRATVARMLEDSDGRRLLAAADSRTLDWLLANHTDLEQTAALLLAGRQGQQTLEPYVMAALVNRFGAAAAAAARGAQSTARQRAAGQWSPMLRTLVAAGSVRGTSTDPVAAAALAQQLNDELGDNRAAWEVAVNILETSGPEYAADDLATVALGVAGG